MPLRKFRSTQPDVDVWFDPKTVVTMTHHKAARPPFTEVVYIPILPSGGMASERYNAVWETPEDIIAPGPE